MCVYCIVYIYIIYTARKKAPQGKWAARFPPPPPPLARSFTSALHFSTSSAEKKRIECFRETGARPDLCCRRVVLTRVEHNR